VDYVLLISGIITSIVTALIGIWYTRQYLTDRYRRKILKVIFSQYIEYPLKNGKYKDLWLDELLDDIYFLKFLKIVLFLIVFISISGTLKCYKSFYDMFITFNVFSLIYSFSLIFLDLYLNPRDKNENLIKININKYSIKRYIIKRSFYTINSDFFFEWIGVTMIFFMILFGYFSLSVLSSNWVFVLAIFWVYTFLLLYPIFSLYNPLKYRILKPHDLRNVIFQDSNINISIIVHINGETIKGKIIEIGDELVLNNNETESHSEIYVPWENIVFFEVVNN
jgi:hypothetical protein